MTLQARSNSAYSTVAVAPITPTAGVALTVATGEGARFSGITTPFYATVWASGAQPVWAAGGATGGNFEVVQVTAVVVDVLTIVRVQEGTAARSVLVGDQIAETLTAQTFRDAQSMPRSPRSSNTILGVADGGTVICATTAYTQTLAAAATLGVGWWCVLKNDTQNGTTVLVVDPNGSETLDGLTTATMYSGETRLIECDGSNFTSQLLRGGYAKFTPTGGNFIVPAGIESLDVVCIGSGGQGGGGFAGGSGSGGAGGGGAGVSRAILRASDFSAGATVTVTVSAGGSAAGAGGIQGGATATPGSNGGSTSFGTALKAGGGGGGLQGASNAGSGSGGGGSAINSATTVTAGLPSSTTPIGGQAATSSSAGSDGKSSEWGGASGGGSSSNTNGGNGGSSIFGGPGGASGGSAAVGGSNGGANQSYAASGGPSGGSGGASPNPGGSGAATTPSPYCGQAGGGGGGSATTGVTAGAGGAGGIGAGGGGGGGSTHATGSVGGKGGNGGAGECRVWYS